MRTGLTSAVAAAVLLACRQAAPAPRSKMPPRTRGMKRPTSASSARGRSGPKASAGNPTTAHGCLPDWHGTTARQDHLNR
jgi:hypothetical protein